MTCLRRKPSRQGWGLSDMTPLPFVVPASATLRLPMSWVGKRVEVSVAKVKRTTSQNRLLWGPVYKQTLERMLLAEGDEPDEARSTHGQLQAHYGLLMLHYGVTIDPITKMQVPKKTSSQLTTTEMSEHVAFVIRKAAKDYGIVIEGID